MQTINRKNTLFVGVDVHKDTHTAVGLNPFGEKVFEMVIGNSAEDFISLIEKTKSEASNVGLVPSFGLEDVHSWGERLSSFLVEEGLPVKSVAPVLVDHHRSQTTHPEKSDSLDAQGVAEVMIQKIDTLPIYTLTDEAQKAKQIRELSLEREWLVKERARLKNQLHILLHRIHNSEYRTKFKDPFALKALRYWKRSAPRNTDTILLGRMKRNVRRLLDLREEIKKIEEELSSMINKSGYTIATASGCGVVIAAELVGEISDVNRFHSPGALAKYAGCAPREHSSGKTIRWRKTRSGNRRLNRAFHRMALSQISRSGNDAARMYFKRKISEGKTKAQSLVCLRRQLVNVVWMMLKHKTEYRLPVV
ncbi:IS110 family transposase [Patescibacteria group bacterium]|nr:IS110 family transposase [Patescibacteria group bacterium]